MAGLEVYQEYPANVPAGEVLTIDTTGNYISCLSSNIDFAVGVDNSEPQFFTAGLKARTIAGEPFRNVQIDNRAGASPLTASVGIGTGDLEDNRLTTVSGVSISKATILDTVADVSVANAAAPVVLAALTTRRRAYIQNLDGAATVRVGDSTVTATRGLRLGPGERQTFETTEAIHVRNDSGTAVLVAVAWEAD